MIGYEHNFDVEQNQTSQGLSYDYMSVMHFCCSMFARCRRHPTLIPKRSFQLPCFCMGEAKLPSDLDYLHVNLLYCGGKKTNMLSNNFIYY